MLPKLLRFILPLMISSMLQLAFNAADLIVVGRFGRPTALAAVGSNVALVSLVVNTFMGLSIGGGVLCARFYGAKDRARLNETVSTALIVGLLGGVLLGALGVSVARPLRATNSMRDVSRPDAGASSRQPGAKEGIRKSSASGGRPRRFRKGSGIRAPNR